MLAASAGVWWLGVRTMDGQSYEDIVWSKFDAALPGWLAPVVHVFAISAVVITVSVIMGAIAFAVLIVRKRWLSIAQLAVFGGLCFAAAELLKPLLPRPYLINLESNPNNSAPSGHVILAAAASVMLLCAVPRVLRALVAVIGWAYTVLVGLSVIAAQWHRPTDVIMALLIVGGLNWGCIGLFQFDLVAFACGGSASLISRIIYTVVGLSAVWCISLLFRDTTDRRA